MSGDPLPLQRGLCRDHLSLLKNTMSTTNSTRVQAPNSISVDEQQFNDSITLKPATGGVVDDVLMSRKQPEKHPNIKEEKNRINKKEEKNLKSLVSCTTDTFLGTLNVRTIREDHKRLELATLFLRSNIKVLGIQEHRIVHEEEVKIERYLSGVHLITSSAWRNGRGAATGGVGVMLAKTAYNAITLIKSYGQRILLISFDGNPRLTVIIVYSPTEAATDEEAEDFHNNLRAAHRDVPAHHLLLTLGDLNAHLGKESNEDTGWYLHDRTNRNGTLLRDTLQEGHLEATNHRFQKKSGKMWTFLSDGTLTKSLIDYILIKKKWRNSLKDTVVSNSFSSLGSDHRAVICKVKLSLRKQKTPPRT